MGKKKSRSKKRVDGFQIMAFYESPSLHRLEKLVHSIDLSILELGRELYNIHLQYPNFSMRRLCSLVGFEIPIRSARFYQSLINVHKHFVIECEYRIENLVGVNFRVLRLIAETKRGIFDFATTSNMIQEIKKHNMSSKKCWEYIKKTRLKRQYYFDHLYRSYSKLEGKEQTYAMEKS